MEGIPADFAVRLVAEKRWEAAEAFLESEVAAGRETASGSLLMAWIALINNDLRAVEVWCHESLRLAPGEPGPHLLLGLVLERANRWEEALSEFELALSASVGAARRAALEQHKSFCSSQIPEW